MPPPAPICGDVVQVVFLPGTPALTLTVKKVQGEATITLLMDRPDTKVTVGGGQAVDMARLLFWLATHRARVVIQPRSDGRAAEAVDAEFSAKSQQVTCPACAGTCGSWFEQGGSLPPVWVPCNTCHGTGVVEEPVASPRKEIQHNRD